MALRRPPLATAVTTQRGAIAALATSSFVFVTAETLPVGLLPQIASGLSVSEAQVGLLLTTYAAVAAFSAIPLTALTMRIPRNLLLAGLVGLFTLSQGAAAIAPTFALLAAARLLCALAHGVFWSAIAPVAARLAPVGQAGRATSLVFVGNTVAFVLGVPLGTALGQAAGWRTALAILALAGAASTATLLYLLPVLPASATDLASGAGTRIRAAIAVLASRSMVAVCTVTAVLVVGQFAAYTYIAPIVRRNGGLDGLALSGLLLGYGVAGMVGNVLVGRVVDRRPGTVLAGSILTMAVALLALTVTSGAPATILAVLAWGAGFTAVPVCLQSVVLQVAPQAQDAASAVYVVAFQIGIGGGALLGERLVTAGRLADLPLLGAVVALLSAAVVLTARGAFPLRRALSKAAPARPPAGVP